MRTHVVQEDVRMGFLGWLTLVSFFVLDPSTLKGPGQPVFELLEPTMTLKHLTRTVLLIELYVIAVLRYILQDRIALQVLVMTLVTE